MEPEADVVGHGSAYRTLHHEVLMALAGYPGNLFMVSKDSGVLEVRDGEGVSKNQELLVLSLTHTS